MLNFEELKKIQRGINLKEAKEALVKNESWIMKKIENHLERNPFLELDKEYFKKMALKNDLLLSFIAKDPSRQNFTEKAVFRYIEDDCKRYLKCFENLANNNSTYVEDGEIVHKATKPTSKTIDYIGLTKSNIQIIATQKYTKTSGGSQNLQEMDVKNFIIEADKNNDSEKVFLAIVDGEYYTKDKLDQIRKLITSKNVFVCHGDEVKNILKQYS